MAAEPAPDAPAASMSDTPIPLDRFAAGALDWPAVRELIQRHALSSLGKRALAELEPRGDESACAALARVGELELLGGQRPPFGGVLDPAPLLEQARRFGRSIEAGDFARLAGLLRAGVELAGWLERHAGAAPRCAALFEEVGLLEELRRAIEGCVDSRGNVVDSASTRLAQLRREMSRLARLIERGLKKLIAGTGVRRFLADGQAQIHRRGGRSVLAVKARHAGQVPGIVHDRSQSEETLFVEPRELVEPNNQLQALRSDEAAEVQRILTELTLAVLEREDEIDELSGRIAELELAVIGADWAAQIEGRCALLPGEPGAAEGLLLRSLRHPLLLAQEREGRLERAVPIDLRLGGDFDMLVITGPNTGGKTAALKSTGLAALLTRLGLPVPCERGTTVPLYDGVVADIGDEQELQQNLSTFSSHLARIAEGLARAGPRTLVLLDELGGGTDPDEGAALGDAILEELLGRGAHTLASTHLGVLKEFAYRHTRAENACAEFDVESLRPLYRLLVGTPGESRALSIARRLGLDGDLLDRAAARLRRPQAEMRQLMEDVRVSRRAAEQLRSEADQRLVGLEHSRRELESVRADVERSRELMGEEAERDLEERVRSAGPLVEQAEALLGQLPPAPREQLAALLERLRSALAGAGLTERREAFLAGLKPGEQVYLPRFGRRCSVVKVKRNKREVIVRHGNQRLTIGFEDVSMFERL